MSQASLFAEPPPDRGAVFSTCGTYRYRLWRRANRPGRRLLWIMLNPSTAGAELDDHTIRKCLGFGERWECGRQDVVNAFAFRATDPRALLKAPDPIGPDNDNHLVQVAAEDPGMLIVAAWGGSIPRAYRHRPARLRELLPGREVMCLSKTDGGPRYHQDCCILHSQDGRGECDCLASDESDGEWGEDGDAPLFHPDARKGI